MKVARNKGDSGTDLAALKFKGSMSAMIRDETVGNKDYYEIEGQKVLPIEIHTQVNPIRDKSGTDYHFDKFHITYVWPDKTKTHYWWNESGKNWSADKSAHDAPDGALERAAAFIKEIKKHY